MVENIIKNSLLLLMMSITGFVINTAHSAPKLALDSHTYKPALRTCRKKCGSIKLPLAQIEHNKSNKRKKMQMDTGGLKIQDNIDRMSRRADRNRRSTQERHKQSMQEMEKQFKLLQLEPSKLQNLSDHSQDVTMYERSQSTGASEEWCAQYNAQHLHGINCTNTI